jgi:hypothetical protein
MICAPPCLCRRVEGAGPGAIAFAHVPGLDGYLKALRRFRLVDLGAVPALAEERG